MKNIFLVLFSFWVGIVYGQAPHFRVELYAAVDKLNLREEPNTSSRIITQIAKKDGMIWLQEMTDRPEPVIWKGESTMGRWFKVNAFYGCDTCIGWVFEKGVNVKEINFTFDEVTRQYINFDTSIPFENYWIKFEPSMEKAFLQLQKTKIINTKSEKEKHRKDSLLSLIPNREIIQDIISYNFSPNQRAIVFPLSYDPGGMFGLSFFRLNTSVITSTEIFGFNKLLDFRWINDFSGIAKYRGTKEEFVYSKFIFKNI